MKIIYAEEIITFIQSETIKVLGFDKDIYVSHIGDILHVDNFTLDWISPFRTNQQQALEDSIAPIVLVQNNIVYSSLLKRQKKIIILVENPKRTLAKIVNHFWITQPEPGINPNATVSTEANVSETATISAGCVLGNCTIGDYSILQPNVTIYDNVKIGANCLIQSGAIIGTDGLGCERENDGTLIKFPHLGGVVINNNVEIGANSQIAKGVTTNTIIENGCKINGLCFIAHNCHLEENVWITGNTMLAGSVYVEKNTTIYSKVIVREQMHIGHHSVIGMGSVVTKHIPNNEVWYGSPAHKNKTNE